MSKRSNVDSMEKEKARAFEFMQKINWILAQIRETEVGIMETKPSEDPNKKAIVRVVFPAEGGVLSYLDGIEHPMKGFCYGETVETVDEVKKTLMAFLNGFFSVLLKNKVRTILFSLLFRKQFEEMMRIMVIKSDYRMRRVRQKPIKYCRCAREVYRVFNLMAIWYPQQKEFIESVRNIICMGLEYDDAYRFPLQDVIVEFNKTAGRKDIIKETRRLLDILIHRDSRGTEDQFGVIRKALILLRFRKSLKEALRRFFLELNLNEMKMDDLDNFHARFKEGYNWDHNEKEKEETKETI